MANEKTITINIDALPDAQKAYRTTKYLEAITHLQKLLLTNLDPRLSYHNNYVYLLINLVKFKSSELFHQKAFALALSGASGRHKSFIEKLIAAGNGAHEEIDRIFEIVCAFLRQTNYQEASFFQDLRNTAVDLEASPRPELACKVYQFFMALQGPHYPQFTADDKECLMHVQVRLAEQAYAHANLAEAKQYFEQFNQEYKKADASVDATVLPVAAFNLHAEMDLDQQDYISAERYFSRALRMDKNNGRAKVGVAALTFYRGEHTQALQQLLEVLPRCDEKSSRAYILLAEICVVVVSQAADKLSDFVKIINHMKRLQRYSLFRVLIDGILKKLETKAYTAVDILTRLILQAANKKPIDFSGTLADIILLVNNLPQIMVVDSSIAIEVAKLAHLIETGVRSNNAVESRCLDRLVGIAHFYQGNYAACHKNLSKLMLILPPDTVDQTREIYLKAFARVLIQMILIEGSRDSGKIKHYQNQLQALPATDASESLISFCQALCDYSQAQYESSAKAIFALAGLDTQDNYCYGVGLYVVASCLYRSQKNVLAWQIYSRALHQHGELLVHFPQLCTETETLAKQYKSFPQRPYHFTIFYQHDIQPAEKVVAALREHRWSQAVALLKQLAEMSPACSQLDFYFGVIFHLFGKLNLAIQNYGASLQKDPNDFRAAYNREIALIAFEESSRSSRPLS